MVTGEFIRYRDHGYKVLVLNVNLFQFITFLERPQQMRHVGASVCVLQLAGDMAQSESM